MVGATSSSERSLGWHVSSNTRSGRYGASACGSTPPSPETVSEALDMNPCFLVAWRSRGPREQSLCCYFILSTPANDRQTKFRQFPGPHWPHASPTSRYRRPSRVYGIVCGRAWRHAPHDMTRFLQIACRPFRIFPIARLSRSMVAQSPVPKGWVHGRHRASPGSSAAQIFPCHTLVQVRDRA